MKNSGEQTQILIVGAGIIGIACAHYLIKAGYSVTVIDQSTIGSGCSYGNCGYVCPSHVLPLTEPGAVSTGFKSLFNPSAAFRIKPRFSLALMKWLWEFAKRCNHKQMLAAASDLKVLLDASITEYRQLVSELECEWQDKGLLYVLQSEHGLTEFAETEQLINEQFGLSARFIPGEELPAFDPAIKMGLAGAYHYENDAHLRPDKLTTTWAEYLKKSGATFIENCELTSVNKINGKIISVETSKGLLTADRYIIAAGAWSAKLAKALNSSIPIQPGKGYSLTMSRPDICPKYPILFPEHGVGVTPFESGYRLGSMMEFSGFDSSIPKHRIQQLKDSAKPYLVEPFTHFANEAWQGWRPMTWDSLPIIGRVPSLDNTYITTGHNMLGVTLAPATGKLISEIIQGKDPYINPQAYSPDRF